MPFYFPFGQELRPLVQEDVNPKKVFVLGVYASAVHARWKKDGQIICQALAVASEPRIFWDGDPEEAKRIIDAVPANNENIWLMARRLNDPYEPEVFADLMKGNAFYKLSYKGDLRERIGDRKTIYGFILEEKR